MTRKKRESRRDIYLANFDSTDDRIAEAFRMLRLHLDCLHEESKDSNKALTLLVTSALPSEGKTTVACNLALSSAYSGFKTLLIDGDTRNPFVHYAFGCERVPGLTDMLLSDKNEAPHIVTTQHANLSLLSAGRSVRKSSELLISKAFTELLDNARKKYHLIVLDSPPIGLVADAGIIAGKTDHLYLIVRSGKTNKRTVGKAVQTLRKLGVEITGVVLTRCDLSKNRYLYHTDYPGYYSTYYSDNNTES
ncbi:CpsD/CapB family tyrosine-protein kinase [bacterium]|nr:CpsD/CapB family tyrosine-protein kinase [bacterium]